MRQNPAKCTFGLGSKKFLGYLVSKGVIEANLEKIRVILDMRSPQTFKDVQRLIERTAALRPFISLSNTLKGSKNEKTF